MNQMPPEVATAICDVMAGVKTLGKDGKNQHQRYDFVSTDAFLAAVNPLCAAAGLAILQDEESVEVATSETADDYGKVKSRTWLTARYSFVLVHKSGAAYGPLRRSVMVQASGAQAFGSAQSYALKQFMRSLFQISTGDKDDADLQPADDLPNQRRQHQQRPAVTQQQNRTPFDDDPGRHHGADDNTPLDKITDPRELAKRMVALIVKAGSLKAVNELMLLWGEQPGKGEPKPGSLLARLPDGGKWVGERADGRRGVLAQEPGQKAA